MHKPEGVNEERWCTHCEKFVRARSVSDEGAEHLACPDCGSIRLYISEPFFYLRLGIAQELERLAELAAYNPLDPAELAAKLEQVIRKLREFPAGNNKDSSDNKNTSKPDLYINYTSGGTSGRTIRVSNERTAVHITTQELEELKNIPLEPTVEETEEKIRKFFLSKLREAEQQAERRRIIDEALMRIDGRVTRVRS